MRASISTAFLALASAIGASASPLAPRQNQTRAQIDPALFTPLQRYARFCSATTGLFLLGRKCPSPPFNAPVVHLIENHLTDTQAAIFQDDEAKEFILSFPGSSSLQDFVTDFSFFFKPTYYTVCPDCLVHSGFSDSWRSIADETFSTLRDLTAKNPEYGLVITGHSLGGALASIAFPEIKASSLPLKAVYTYGSPRVGNAAFADFTDSLSAASEGTTGQMYRVTHHTDGVPDAPGLYLGYRHSRTEYFQLDDSTGTQTAQTTFRCFGQEAPDCNLGSANGFINADHLVYSGIRMVSGAQCGLPGGL